MTTASLSHVGSFEYSPAGTRRANALDLLLRSWRRGSRTTYESSLLMGAVFTPSLHWLGGLFASIAAVTIVPMKERIGVTMALVTMRYHTQILFTLHLLWSNL